MSMNADDRLLPTIIDSFLLSLISHQHNNATKIDADNVTNRSHDYYQQQLYTYYVLLCVHLFALLTNAFIIVISIHRRRRQLIEKIAQLVLNLALVNCIISICYLFVIIFIHNSTIMFMIDPIRTTIPTLHLMQSFALFHLAFDRYLSLFDRYTPSLHQAASFMFILLLPYTIGALFDYRFLTDIYQLSSRTIITLLTFVHLMPILFAIVLIGCVLGRQRRRTPNNYRKRKYYSIAIAICAILIVMCICEKLAYFANWILLASIASPNTTIIYEHLSSRVLNYLLIWYRLARCAREWSALYIATICLILMTPFRRSIIEYSCIRKRRKIDYNRESLRSIIGGRMNVLPRNMMTQPNRLHIVATNRIL